MNHLRAAQQCRDKVAARYEKGMLWLYGLRKNLLFMEVEKGQFAERPVSEAGKYRDWKAADSGALVIFMTALNKVKVGPNPVVNKTPVIMRQ